MLTRTESFKGVNQQPIVANAEQMLIVSAVTEPPVKWGFVDRMIVAGRTTVLAGHSGVGQSSLIVAVEDGLDIRIEAISGYTGKGRHTTTSAHQYPLWGVTAERLIEFFPDVEADTAPPWRKETYARILAMLS